MAGARRLLRPLVPDRVVSWYRLSQQSRHARVNVDVFVSNADEVRRWLAATPDTYRIRLRPSEGPSPDAAVIADSELEVPEHEREKAFRALADPDIEAVVVGEVSTPRLIDRSRNEPEIGPRLIVTTDEVLSELGGGLSGDHPLPELLARLRDAGARLGLVPLEGNGAPRRRLDQIHRPAIAILALVPMHDIGGGSRSAQLAIEFVRMGFHVVYVSLFGTQESVDLGLRFIHPHLEQYSSARFDPAMIIERSTRPGVALVEAPAPVLAKMAFALGGNDWSIVYDVIDDWSDPALGGDWYDVTTEKRLTNEADRVVASAPDLVRRVESMGRSAELVPNAVNADVFGVQATERPRDLPEASTIIGYHGSLYGDWFDWNALAAVAKANPGAAVVMIGDDKAPRPPMPDNVVFLGLKPHSALPAYVQHFEVGLLPFKVNETTHSVSPLKVYEYLASGVPVAAPPLRSLNGLDGVFMAGDLPDAVTMALLAPPPDRDLALVEQSWTERARRICDPTTEERAAAVVSRIRPVRHFTRAARRPAAGS